MDKDSNSHQDSTLENKIFSDLAGSKSNFGAGFILGAIFVALAIFLATKTGRELVKKINLEDFDLDKFSKLFTKDNNLDEANDLEYQQDIKNTQTQTPVLGKRFFRHQ